MELSTHKEYIRPDGKQLPSVTTITSLLNKPALLKWANWLGFKKLSYEAELEERARIGTFAHMMIEVDLKEKLFVYRDNTPEFSKAIPRFLGYQKWREDNPSFKLIESELSLVGDKYGGTLDCYCELDGKKTIIDWKTSKKFYDSMFLQLSAYRHLIELCREEKVEQVGIVLLKDEGYKDKFMSIDKLDGYFKVFSILTDLFYGLVDIDYKL